MKPKFYKMINGNAFRAKENGDLYIDDNGSTEPLESTDGLESVDEVEAQKHVTELVKRSVSEARTKSVEELDLVVKSLKSSLEEVVDSMKSKKTVDIETKSTSLNIQQIQSSFKAFANGESAGMTIEFKSLKDLPVIEKALSISGSLSDVEVIEADRDTEITAPVKRTTFMESLGNVIPTTSNRVSYVEIVSQTGTALPTAELAALPEISYNVGVFYADVKKVGAFTEHSKEILQDAPAIVGEVENLIQEDVRLKIDEQLLTGSGVGENILGLLNVAPTFTSLMVGAKRVAQANLYDVVRVMMSKIASTGKFRFQPNVVLVNPLDEDELDLTKDANGQYVVPGFVVNGNRQIKGAIVVSNELVPAGKVLVGDFTKFRIRPRTGYEMEMTNSHSDRFIKDIITIKVTRRLAAYVRQNHNGAFLQADIATIKTALTAA